MIDMNKKESIQKLEKFKELLIRWNNIDYKSQQTTQVRAEINKLKATVQRIVYQTGAQKKIDIAPPPAVGGFIMRGIDPFEVMFEAPYDINVTSIIIDSIDEAIGIIESTDHFIYENTTKKKNEVVKGAKSSNKIFIVHGRDNELKETIARFIEKIGLKPIILHEQANSGQTIIEKFEKYSDVQYSIVLMSPDDVGNIKEKASELNQRARQNVIFELGYFYGKLGRKNVCAIIKGDIERPSDNDGIIYIGFDVSEGWKMLLGKELKTAGLEFDLNKVF
jgi:predicted nucleotide-binding protein